MDYAQGRTGPAARMVGLDGGLAEHGGTDWQRPLGDLAGIATFTGGVAALGVSAIFAVYGRTLCSKGLSLLSPEVGEHLRQALGDIVAAGAQMKLAAT